MWWLEALFIHWGWYNTYMFYRKVWRRAKQLCCVFNYTYGQQHRDFQFVQVSVLFVFRLYISGPQTALFVEGTHATVSLSALGWLHHCSSIIHAIHSSISPYCFYFFLTASYFSFPRPFRILASLTLLALGFNNLIYLHQALLSHWTFCLLYLERFLVILATSHGQPLTHIQV